MIRRTAAPSILIGAAIGVCALFIALALRQVEAPWMLVPLSLLAFLAGRAPAWPAGAIAVLLLLAGVAAGQLIAPDGGSVVPEFMLLSTLYLAGLALRGREALATSLKRQSSELRTERDAYARLSVRYERARIAAELHDVVAHAISVMVVQASAGQALAKREPARVSETFDVIAHAARQAQSDLDGLADLLAQDATPDGGIGLELLPKIVDAAKSYGLPVTLIASGDTSGVSGTAAHAALRVVQESLTNALRYAPGAEVEVAVQARPGALELMIVNGRPTTSESVGLGSGLGLRGLRERVNACGGTLDAGADTEGGWRVQARLPS